MDVDLDFRVCPITLFIFEKCWKMLFFSRSSVSQKMNL